jgi:hypothetical protein
VRVGIAAENAAGACGDLPLVADPPQREMVRGGPPYAIAPVITAFADEHEGFAHRHRLVAGDRHGARSEEVTAPLGHQVPVGRRTDHGVNVRSAFHPPAVDVINAVDGPQPRGGVGVARVDRGTV